MRKKIGELLIEAGAVSPEQIHTALGRQRNRGQSQRLGSVIITLGFTSPTEVAKALARQMDLPFIQLPADIPEAVASIVSLDFQTEHRLVPFRLEREGRAERLHVAVDDPSDLSVVEELGFQLNKPIRVYVAAEDDLDQALGLVRGHAVDAIALEEDSGEPLEVEHGNTPMVAGGWHEPEPPPGGSAPPVEDWALPPAGTLSEDTDDSLTPTSPRSALKPKPPAPPAPPPFDEDEDAITLITPKPSSKARAARPPPPPPPPQESEEVLDELLGEPEGEEGGGAPGVDKKGVPVVMFGGAAKNTPLPPRAELPDISEEDLKVLEDLERMADGSEAELHTEKVKPARMVASLIRLLIRKRIIHEEEFLEELSRK